MLVCSQENPSKLKSLNHNYSLNGTVPLGWLVLHSGVYHNFHYWNMALFLLLQVNWTRNRTKWLTGQCDYISSAHYCPHIFFYAFFFFLTFHILSLGSSPQASSLFQQSLANTCNGNSTAHAICTIWKSLNSVKFWKWLLHKNGIQNWHSQLSAAY